VRSHLKREDALRLGKRASGHLIGHKGEWARQLKGVTEQGVSSTSILPDLPGEKIEIHHKDGVQLIEPLLRHGNDADNIQLIKYIQDDLQIPLYNSKGNLVPLAQSPEHDDIHRLLVDSGVQFDKNTVNFKNEKLGRLLNDNIDSDLDTKKLAAKEFFGIAQPIISKHTNDVIGTQESRAEALKGKYMDAILALQPDSAYTQSRVDNGLLDFIDIMPDD